MSLCSKFIALVFCCTLYSTFSCQTADCMHDYVRQVTQVSWAMVNGQLFNCMPSACGRIGVHTWQSYECSPRWTAQQTRWINWVLRVRQKSCVSVDPEWSCWFVEARRGCDDCGVMTAGCCCVGVTADYCCIELDVAEREELLWRQLVVWTSEYVWRWWWRTMLVTYRATTRCVEIVDLSIPSPRPVVRLENWLPRRDPDPWLCLCEVLSDVSTPFIVSWDTELYFLHFYYFPGSWQICEIEVVKIRDLYWLIFAL